MEIVKTPFKRLAVGIVIGYGLMIMGFMTTASLLIPLKVMSIDPKNYATSYGLVAGISAIFALVGNPIGGAISDRSTISFGRRRIWILLGSLIGSLCIISILFSKTVMAIVIAWSAAQFFYNFSWAAYTALIPEQVEESKRGTMSGIFGIIIPVFMTLGMLLINIFVNASDTFKFVTFALISVIGPIISLFIIQEGKVEFVKKADNIPMSEKIKKIIPSPKKYPEFSWAWISKFLLMLGGCASLYTTVMLGSRMHMNQAQITATYSMLSIAGLGFSAITSLFGGVLSDKAKKQKIFLYISSVIMAIGVVMYIIPSVQVFFIASIIGSLGSGCFGAVDTALVSRILPNKEDTAKDFGIMNVANCLPQSIVPAVAPVLLAIGGWNFFYLSLALMPILGILTTIPIPDLGHKLKNEREAELSLGHE